MSNRVHTSPWCGAVTDSEATIKFTVKMGVNSAKLIVSKLQEFIRLSG
ncbi:MAG: hypothetical protein JNN15_11485 [Blastocatellia bacterium]|nr:hypothetical protein [Blastocatellia bacterium]